MLGYIEQCQWVFKKFGHPTYMDCYPERLKLFLKRKIWQDMINSFSSNEKKWLAGYFIKPIKDKAFTKVANYYYGLDVNEQDPDSVKQLKDRLAGDFGEGFADKVMGINEMLNKIIQKMQREEFPV